MALLTVRQSSGARPSAVRLTRSTFEAVRALAQNAAEPIVNSQSMLSQCSKPGSMTCGYWQRAAAKLAAKRAILGVARPGAEPLQAASITSDTLTSTGSCFGQLCHQQANSISKSTDSGDFVVEQQFLGPFQRLLCRSASFESCSILIDHSCLLLCPHLRFLRQLLCPAAPIGL